MEKDQVNILITSDDSFDFSSISAKLDREGFRTRVAQSADFLKIFDQRKQQALIYVVTGKSGFRAAPLLRIKSSAPRTLVILYQLQPNIDDAIQAVNQGIAAKIVSGTNREEEITSLIETARKNGDLPSGQAAGGVEESADLLKKYNEVLQSNLKARTQSILQKKLRLEAINYELQSNLFETIKALFSYLERKNQWIGRHSKMVAALSYELCMELKLPNKLSEMIEIAAMLHDVGKVGIPDNIISRSAHLLTPQQAETAAKHVFIGKELLDPIVSLKDVGEMILFHHEHFDGNGYPDNLIGDAIPIGARIIAVADTFNNLMEKSHHRAQNTYTKSIKDLESKSGTILDPKLIPIFVEMMEKNRNRQVKAKSETAVSITGLAPGMMLARDIFSTRGTNIIRKGQVMSEQHIAYIKEFDRIEKIMGEIYIYE